MIYFLSFIFIISLPIFLHELGHFLAARSVGIKVEKFYFGFNFFGLGIKKKYKETEYGIGLFHNAAAPSWLRPDQVANR